MDLVHQERGCGAYGRERWGWVMMSGGWSGSESGVRQAARVSESATWCMCVSELVVRGVCVFRVGTAGPAEVRRGW